MPDRKSLGLLLAAPPSAPGFRHALGLAEAALRHGFTVYLYCIDEGIRALGQPELDALQRHGARLFACAFAAQRRHLPLSGTATPAGLAMLGDLIAGTDRFVAFT